MKRISIIYSHYPHYRKPIFDSLKISDTFDFKLFYGYPNKSDGILLVSDEDDDTVLKTYKIGNIIIQVGFLREAIGRESDAIIFLGNPYILTNWIYASLARIRGKKVFFWTHGWTRRDRGFTNLTRKSYYRIANGLLLYGRRAKEIGIEEGFNPSHLHVIYNSLDYPTQKVFRERLISSGARSIVPYTFLFIGRLTREVELDVAIRALAVLKAGGTKAILNILGTGAMEDSLRSLSVELDVDVKFMGESYEESVIARHLLSSSAVVSPGKVGLLAMHALAYGVPVLTHDDFDQQMPEVEAIEEGVTGGFFRKGDARDLAQLMKAWGTSPPHKASETAIRTIEERYTPAAQKRNIEHALQTSFSESGER